MAGINSLNPLMQEQDVQKTGTVVRLKITVNEETGQTKMMQFDPATYINDCLKEVAEAGKIEDFKDYGLYFLMADISQCRWLQRDKTLRYYDVHNFDQLVLKKKHRPLAIELMDKSKRKAMIDDSDIVQQIVKKLCEKFNVANDEEYSLKKVESADGEWLDPNRTLHEQGIEATDELLLKKKFSYHDANVDTNDKTSLNLLYEQVREEICVGKLPVEELEAIDFAALQCQVILGPHNASKHTPRNIKVAAFLPPENRKTKKIAERILREHKSLGNMSVEDAKYRFLQYARSLATYGITVWKVKEPAVDKKGKAKKKFAEVLLGVSRDSIYRLDPITKKNCEGSPYSLTQLRRWAPSKNSLTLDFGDHMDEYYTVLTAQGDEIAALIDGYIEIILNQRKDRMKGFEDDEEHQATVDGGAQPMTAATSSYRKSNKKKKTKRAGEGGDDTGAPAPVRRRPGVVSAKGNKPVVTEEKPPEATTIKSVASELDTAFHKVLTPAPVNQQAIIASMDLDDEELDAPAKEKKKLKNLQGARDLLSDVLGDLSLAAGDCVAASAVSDPDALEKDALVASAKRIVQLSNELDQVAAMNAIVGENGSDLDQAKTELGDKMSKLLDLAKLSAIDLDGGGDGNMDILLAAARAVGGAINNMLGVAGVQAGSGANAAVKADELTAEADKMLAATKDIKLADPSKQKELEAAQKNVANLAKQINAQVAMAGGCVADDKTQAELDLKGEALSNAINQMLTLADAGGLDPLDLESLMNAAKAVQAALGNLVGTITDSKGQVDNTNEIIKACSAIASAVDEVASADTPATMKAAVEQLTNTATALGALAQKETETEQDNELKAHLEEVCHSVAAAIPPLQTASDDYKAAKADAKAPAHAKVEDEAAKLGEIARQILSERKQKAALTSLANAAKKSANAVLELNDVVEESGDNRNPAAKMKAEKAAAAATTPNEKLVEAAQVYQAQPSNVQYQKDLLQAVKAATAPSSRAVVAGKNASSGCELYTDQEEMQGAAVVAGEALNGLMEALKAAQDACWALDCAAALDVCASAKTSLDTAAQDALAEKLERPQYGTTQQSAMDELTDLTDTVPEQVQRVVASMRNVGAEGFGTAAKDCACTIDMLAGATVMVAAFSDDKAAQEDNIAAMMQLAAAMTDLLKSARSGVDKPTDKEVQSDVVAAREDIENAVKKLLTTLPGQGDCISTRDEMISRAAQVDVADLPPAEEGKGLADYKDDLQASTRALASSVSKLVSAANASPNELGVAARKVGTVMSSVNDAAAAAASTSSQQSAKHAIVGALRALATVVADTVERARIVGAEPDNLDAPKELADQANMVNPSIDEMLAALSAAAPGQSACDEASDAIEASAAKLNGGFAVAPEGSSFKEYIDKLLDCASALTTDVAALTDSAKNSPDKVGEKAGVAAKQVDKLADVAATTATLVPGAGNAKFNAHQFDAQADKVLSGISALVSAGDDPKKIVKAATAIAKASQVLADAAKTSSADLDDDSAKASMSAASQSINNATSKLVSAAKKAAKNPDGANLDNLVSRSGDMQKKVMGLLTLASDVVGADPLSQKLQQDLLNAARAVANAVSQLVGSTKVMANNPKDIASQQLLRTADKQVADCLDQLIKAAKSAAPGQKECDYALEEIDSAVTRLDSAVMAASVGDLQAPTGVTAEKAKKGTKSSMKKLTAQTKAIGAAAKADAAALGVAAGAIGALMSDIVKYSTGSAAAITDPDARADVLAAAQALASELGPLVAAAKEAGGDSDNKEANKKISAAQKAVVIGIQGVVRAQKNAEGASTSGGAGGDQQGCEAAASTISAATAMLDQPPAANPNMSYADYQDEVLQRGKKLATTLAKLAQATKKHPDQIGDAARDAADIFPKLCLASVNAAAFSSDPTALLAAARAVADACRDLIGAAKEVEDDQGNADKISVVTKMSGNEVAKSIRGLFTAAQAPATGANETDEAVQKIEAATNELSTAELMANTRQLQPAVGDTYQKYQDDVVKQAKSAASQVSKLIAAGSAESTDLAAAARKTASVVTKLANTVIAAAATLPDYATQAGLIVAAKDLSEALGETVTDTVKLGESKGANKADKKKVKKDAKMAAEAIQRLVQVANSAQKAMTEGVVALDQAASVMNTAVGKLNEGTPTGDATPEQAQEAARNVAKVTTRLLLDAKKSQAAVATASTDTAQSVAALLELCVNSAKDATPEARASFLSSARQVAEINLSIVKILKEAGGTTTNDKAAHKRLMATSKQLADGVADLVGSANLLSNPDYIDADDSSITAEKEMLGAASQIEKSSAKLNKMRPKRGEGNEMSFEEQVVEAGKAIMAAAAQLVKASVVAQKDIVKAGRKEEGTKYHTDATWAGGLISAAQEVASQCSELVNYTGDVVKGKVESPQLVLKAASKGVSSATVHLVTAAQVKGDPNTKSQTRLKKAAKSVGEATKALMACASAKAAAEEPDDPEALGEDAGDVARHRQMMEARLKMLKLQNDLERARRAMSTINQSQYNN